MIQQPPRTTIILSTTPFPTLFYRKIHLKSEKSIPDRTNLLTVGTDYSDKEYIFPTIHAPVPSIGKIHSKSEKSIPGRTNLLRVGTYYSDKEYIFPTIHDPVPSIGKI